MNKDYKLHSRFKPAGDQPEAISKLVAGAKRGGKQTLLGVTGSGKTYTIANMLKVTGRSAIIISHNKTLAAQLYSEFREFFPENKVGCFVSYFDYYQPESYLPSSDTYIEKDSKTNDRIERMRLQATAHLLSDGPSVIVATVSCIYGLGNPEEFKNFSIPLRVGDEIDRRTFVNKLLDMQYTRDERVIEFGKFQLKGSVFTIAPAYEDLLIRVTLDDDKIASIKRVDPINLTSLQDLGSFHLYPARHYLMSESAKQSGLMSIRQELEQRLPELGRLEAYRLKQRTNYDLELIEEVGFCTGIENYSRHFDGRKEGEPPFCLLNFLPDDGLIIIDESHVTIPQLHGMYHGDRSRKKNLIDFGFRLPSAYDNRPLKWEEFEKFMNNAVFVSATPADYEKEVSDQIVEQLVRPTGIVDPEVFIHKTEGQMDDLLERIKQRAEGRMRTLVTTLTKRMAEDLAEYLASREIKVRYMHSEIDTITRSELIRQLRLGEFDCLVGINLLREGLDIPEVGLVAILDADKQGFLRNTTSLIQTIGRAARNSESQVILYADSISDAMKNAMDETARRRRVQIAYNKEHGITPMSIKKNIAERLGPDEMKVETKHLTTADIHKQVVLLEEQMRIAAENLDFEAAISLRDQISDLKKKIGKKRLKAGDKKEPSKTKKSK